MTEQKTFLEWLEDLAKAACYGVIMNWIALWTTKQTLEPFKDGLTVSGTAGFPFKAMLYPTAPMGGDYVPGDMLLNFAANGLFWAAVAVILMAIPFSPLKRLFRRPGLEALGAITAVFVVIGTLFLLLRFD